MHSSLFRSALPIFILILLFIASSLAASTYHELLTGLMRGKDFAGIFFYTLLALISTVIAPLSSIPLMPMAASIWGAPVTAIASIVGWWLGSLIAFYISRKYGRGFVEKIVSKEKLESLERRIPTANIFWTIVLLRIAVPVDILSYVLGLFSRVTLKTYASASLVGIIPFAFVFAYAGNLPLKLQLFAVAASLLILALVWNIRKS